MAAMASQYDVETKAQALALVRMGKPAKRVAVELGLPIRTVQTWASEQRQMALEEDDRIIADQDYHLVIRTGELIQDALEELAASDQPLYKYLVPLNIVRGTPQDKILRRKESKGTTVHTYGPTLIVSVSREEHEREMQAIEGEVVRSDDDPGEPVAGG